MPAVLLVAYVSAFRGRIVHAIFAQRWVVAMGGMCYTIYLYHIHFIWWVKHWLELNVFGPVQIGRPLVAVPQLALTTLLVLALCAPFFVLFEKPFMRSSWPAALRERWRALVRRAELAEENAEAGAGVEAEANVE
jgi:peptidoglycan/LPS O-acetylase OafA/YrhL